MNKSNDLVTVHHATSLSEAQVVRGVLEEAGILAIIPDANTPLPIDLTPFDNQTGVAGCEVMVQATEHARALDVLRAAREEGSTESEEA